MCAKPIIDVLLGTDDLRETEARISVLAAHGFAYVNKYETELPNRRYFVKQEAETPRVNLHAVVLGSPFWNEHLAFRNALRADAKLRHDYASLKRRLASLHATDRAAYTAAKAPFIQAALRDLPPSIAGTA